VRGAARDDQLEAAETAARRLQVALVGRRLAHERCSGAVRRARDDVAAGEASDLLVGGENDTQRTHGVGAADRLEHHHQPGLHVVRAGAVRAAVVEAPRHRRERAARPDGVDVAEEQQRRARAGEVRPHVLALERHPAAKPVQLGGRPVAHRRRVARGRLELDELAQERDHTSIFP